LAHEGQALIGGFHEAMIASATVAIAASLASLTLLGGVKMKKV
jgi:hypothetical protein